MKKYSKIGLAVILSLCVCAGTGAAGLTSVSAGTSERNVSTEASISKGVINEGDYLVSGRVYAEGDYAVFDENCSTNSKIIAKTKIPNCKQFGVETLFSLESTLKLQDFVTDGKFVLGFGIKSLLSGSGSKGSGELVFTDSDGGISMECNVYKEEGIATNVIPKARLGSVLFNRDFTVEIVVSVDMEMTLTVNGVKMVEDLELKEDMSGYVGFYSYGKNTAMVKGVKITAYRYDNPENLDYTETFDNGYHADVFYSASAMGSMSPAGVYVRDGKLVFENAKDAYFSTRYTYSNFELTFDLSDLQVKPEYDENNNLIKRISSGFGLVFGSNNIKETAYNTVFSGQWLHLEGIPYDPTRFDHLTPYASPKYVLYDTGSISKSVIYMKTGDSAMGIEGYNIWDQANEGKSYTFKFAVDDGVVSLHRKLTEESADKFKLAYRYELGRSPVGYVKIFCAGDQYAMCNFKIDNLSIKNTDFEAVAQKIEVPPFISNERDKTPDFDYTTKPDESDLIGNVDKRDDGCSSSLNVQTGILAGAIIIAAGTVLALRKRRNDR